MKVIALLFFVLATTYAKDELKWSNCGSNAITALSDLSDEKSSGPVDRTSVLVADYKTTQDTSARDPFKLTAGVVIKKYVLFGYVTIPQAMMDKLGEDLVKTAGPGLLKYNGNGQFEATCLFKKALGHCLPPKGSSSHKLPMEKIADGLKRVAGSLANGWFKIHVDATTSWGVQAFCVDVELKSSLIFHCVGYFVENDYNLNWIITLAGCTCLQAILAVTLQKCMDSGGETIVIGMETFGIPQTWKAPSGTPKCPISKDFNRHVLFYI